MLLAMAISGILVGYFVGKYLAPAERFATPPTAEQKQSRSAPDYEERLPSDIVIQSNGAITRIQLPTPDAEIDFGSYERDAAPLSAPRDENAPQKAKEEPDTPETAALTPQDGGPVVKPKPKLAVKPVQLVRAMPDDIAALQASDAAALPAWQRFAVPASLDTRPQNRHRHGRLRPGPAPNAAHLATTGAADVIVHGLCRRFRRSNQIRQKKPVTN